MSAQTEPKRAVSGKRTTREELKQKLDVLTQFRSEPKNQMKIVDELAQKQLIMKT